MNRGEIVPGTGPANERATLRDFADWRTANHPTRREITNQEIEEFIYDQWMLSNKDEVAAEATEKIERYSVRLDVYHDPADGWNDQTYCEECGEKAIRQGHTPGLVKGDHAIDDSICESCGREEA
jgi:hypothetical protein